jgi:hypothetical protein
VSKADAGGRRVKGTGCVDIVKMVRHARKKRRYPAFAAEAEALLTERVLPTGWYSHDGFLALIEFAFVELLGASEHRAWEMGAAGGRAQLLGPHKVFVDSSDPFGAAWSMRHAWRLNFNFGEMRVERDGSSFVYALHGYRDVPPSHAFMIAGWTWAGLQLSGAGHGAPELVERPWCGSSCLSWRLTIAQS